ncbi:MAG: cytochrome P450 [Cyclobacteriaceae bacterium]
MNNTLLWRPLDPAYIRNPYAMYERLRLTDPVYLAQTKEYIITRYDDVKFILKSESFESGNRLGWLKRGVEYFDNKDEDLRAIYQAMNSFILMLNDAQHLRIRNFVNKTWHNREVDDIIRANTNMLLDQMNGLNLDFVAAYAQPLPVYTISHILGIPVTDCQYLIQLGVAMTKTLDLYISLKDLVLMNQAAADFISFFQEQIKLKYDRPDEGLLSKMIHKNRKENLGLSDEELVSIAIFLFTAGEETSASLISNAMLNLLKHPEQLTQLRNEPEMIDSAIEEVLRYDSIVQLLGRISREEVTLGDKIIPAGATVTLVVASANRDEKAFERANEFIISRKPNRHLSFGSGVHYCLGDWLARRQSQLAINAFLRQYPHITLPDQELTWYKNLAVRRLNALHLQVK